MISKAGQKQLSVELDKYTEETNKIFYSLSKILITVAAISITISPNFVSQIINSDTAIILYRDAMGFALISVFAGIAQFYKDYDEFKEYTKYLDIPIIPVSKMNKKQIKLDKKYNIQIGEEATFNTGHRWLQIQIFSVLFSLLLFLTVIFLYPA